MKYEVRVKYAHIDPNSGKEKVVTENYIIADAQTWADAEKQLYTQMAKITAQTVTKVIKLSDIVEILKSEGDWFYKVKIAMSVIDEVTGKEKDITEAILIQAKDMFDAHSKAQFHCLHVVIPVEITSISKSNIVDIFDEDFTVYADESKPEADGFLDGESGHFKVTYLEDSEEDGND